MIDCAQPFVLLDDARKSGSVPARLYKDPVEQFTAQSSGEIAPLLDRLRDAVRNKMHVAGYLAYDAGHQLARGKADNLSVAEQPLAWFGIFQSYQSIRPDDMLSWLREPEGAWLGPISPNIDRIEYQAAFQKVQELIRAGDIYQANLTFRASAQYAGHPLALYAALRERAAAGYGGVVWTGKRWHLSFSPELFFALKDRHVTTKPMKGTAAKQIDEASDKKAIEQLQQDPKQRAENLMIVDLLRNDLSKACKQGTVAVPELFKIESYPTIHQMISTVTGELKEGCDVVDLISAIYPCGSITGAPKIRAMEIIEELEASARGLYCGSIGRIDPQGDAAFNVAIRTFSLCEDKKHVSLGLGSGVVADSKEGDEWAECLAKGEFAKLQRHDFDLIETMRFEPAKGIMRLELHLERMKESARALGFEFDRHDARNRLHAVTFHLDKDSKLRLLLSRSGAISIEIAGAPMPTETPIRAAIIPLPVDAGDFRLVHKTSDREFYDEARESVNADEAVFADSDGFLTEASRSAIFVERDGCLVTPPLSRCLLPSVLRRELIESGKAVEGDLRADDLAGGFLLGNSLRGLAAAKIVA